MIFLGAGFNERTSYLWDARLLAGKQVVQVDSDPAQLEKVFTADLAIHGDIHEVLSEVLATLGARRRRAARRSTACPATSAAARRRRGAEHDRRSSA